MADWSEAKVIDLQRAGSLLVEDGNHGEYRPRPDEFGSGDVAFIRAADLEAGRVLFESASRINAKARSRIIKGVGAGGDILLSHKGTVGKLAIVPLDAPPFVCSPQTTFWRTLDSDRIDRRYLYYYMSSDEFRQQLDSRKGETDMADYVSLTAQRELRVLLPAIEEQQAIARILGTLDDKIELSRRMSHTLEAIARAIFQSWFVDFDPVVAKAEGRKPVGMSAETARLFPKEFEDSPLGPIPKGWRVGRLGEISDNKRRGVNPTDVKPGTAYIGLEHMPRRHISLSDWGLSDGVASNKFRFERGEILFGKLRPYFHKVGVAAIDGVCSTDILVISPKHEHWFGIVLGHASSDELVQYADAGSTGTKMPRTSWQELARYEVVIPDEGVALAFAEWSRQMMNRVAINIHLSRTIANLRDALLPRLLSGELRVKEAEKMLQLA